MDKEDKTSEETRLLTERTKEIGRVNSMGFLIYAHEKKSELRLASRIKRRPFDHLFKRFQWQKL